LGAPGTWLCLDAGEGKAVCVCPAAARRSRALGTVMCIRPFALWACLLTCAWAGATPTPPDQPAVPEAEQPDAQEASPALEEDAKEPGLRVIQAQNDVFIVLVQPDADLVLQPDAGPLPVVREDPDAAPPEHLMVLPRLVPRPLPTIGPLDRVRSGVRSASIWVGAVCLPRGADGRVQCDTLLFRTALAITASAGGLAIWNAAEGR